MIEKDDLSLLANMKEKERKKFNSEGIFTVFAITGRSYRLKDHATIAGKEDKNKKAKSKSSENSAAEPAS